MRHLLIASFTLAATALPAASAAAGSNSYMSLTGQKQRDIKGSVTQKGREGMIAVIAVSHEIVSPRDPQSGLPTGQRVHKPFVITKELDKSSPLLLNVLTTNENLTTVTLQFFAPQVAATTAVGTEVKIYTITLTNANIASIKLVKPNTKDPNNSKLSDYEEIAFTYQKIQWTWEKGGTTASDDWSQRL